MNGWTSRQLRERSGLRASSAAVLCGAVAVYDLVATAWLPLTDQMLARLAAIPLAPVFAWGTSEGDSWLSIGLGDALLATLFPIVQRKAFGVTPGVLALGISLGTIAVLTWLSAVGVLPVSFPVMVALGPLVLLQYTVFRRICGAERTTWEYLRDCGRQVAGIRDQQGQSACSAPGWREL